MQGYFEFLLLLGIIKHINVARKILMQDKEPKTKPGNQRKEIIRFFAIMIPSISVLMFAWLGSVIILNKIGVNASAELTLLGIAALITGGAWAWISLKVKKPFAQKGETLPYTLPAARNPIEKLTRGLFVFVGIALYVAVAIMPEIVANSLLRIISSGGRIIDTLGLLALLGMVIVIVVYDLIVKIKHKLFPQTKPKEKSLYVSWYLNAALYWVVFLILIFLFMYMVYKYMK